jgi:hypothetical protein
MEVLPKTADNPTLWVKFFFDGDRVLPYGKPRERIDWV